MSKAETPNTNLQHLFGEPSFKLIYKNIFNPKLSLHSTNLAIALLIIWQPLFNNLVKAFHFENHMDIPTESSGATTMANVIIAQSVALY